MLGVIRGAGGALRPGSAIPLTEPPSPAEVLLGASGASLRTGRIMSAAVVRHQLDALAAAGYRLQPGYHDDGATVLLKAARRAFRGGHFSPAVVVARQVAALEEDGRTFVLSGEGHRGACAAFEWGPDSFEACGRCGWSYWEHGEGADRGKGAHRGE